ncbi:glutamine synthetase family protein [Rhodospirillum sp. A1_3_36]|uniref:glutamine synthetase family protein n=1 Tax=Rhodospirillum sp. A1_3_36 TaxID=3391666 RepID=UPI0039A7735F
MTFPSPSGSSLKEALSFLDRYPDVQALDIVLTDCHGIGRGKIIRRHELAAIYAEGRPMPSSLFGEDVAGDDVEATGLVNVDGGGDKRCWPIPGSLGLIPSTGRGQVLVSMYNDDGSPFAAEPRNALLGRIDEARAAGFTPLGAFELEFYLIANGPEDRGHHRLAPYALTGHRPDHRNTMAVDELDQMSPFLDSVYAGAEHLGLTLESVISEYAIGQYEITSRYRNLLRAADDVIIAKRLIRTTARRFGFEACFMGKPFGDQAGSGMHLHLSLADPDGNNRFADLPDGSLNPLMLQAIAGIRETIGETMLVLAPFQNSWRRFASTLYSPASDTWGLENRNVAIRVPANGGKGRHFEHRVAGIDANPYMVAAVTLAGAMEGIAHQKDPGPAHREDATPSSLGGSLPRSWRDSMDALEASAFARAALGEELHRSFLAVKRAEWSRLALMIPDTEWSLYGFVV